MAGLHSFPGVSLWAVPLRHAFPGSFPVVPWFPEAARLSSIPSIGSPTTLSIPGTPDTLPLNFLFA